MRGYNNYTEENVYNDSPPLPPSSDPIGEAVVSVIDNNFDANPVWGLYEDFVIEYSGYIQFENAGEYHFYAPADDGVKLYLDGNLVIDDWYDKGGGGSVSQTIQVEAGQTVPFQLWYYENGGGANVQLMWDASGDWNVVPDSAFQMVPPPPPTTTTTEPPTTTTEPPTTTLEETTTTWPQTTLPTTTSTTHAPATTVPATTSTVLATTTTIIDTTTTTLLVSESTSTTVATRGVKAGSFRPANEISRGLKKGVTPAQQRIAVATVTLAILPSPLGGGFISRKKKK